MPQNEEPTLRTGIVRLPAILLVAGLATFFLGVISVTLRPVVRSPYSDFCVGLGIALLVFATIVMTLGLVLDRRFGTLTVFDTARTGTGGDQGQTSPESGKKDRDLNLALNFVLRIFGILLWLGVLGIILFASGTASPLPFWKQFGRLSGLGLLLALGFFATGTLFGFLFGLPRSPRKGDQPVPEPKALTQAGTTPPSETEKRPPQHDSPGYGDNTNLEEVSDWLTKIIVGLGLINLKDVPDLCRRMSDFFTRTCGSDICGGVFLTMGAFFFIVGFISSYILARVYVKLAFALVGAILAPEVKEVATNVVRAELNPVRDLSLVQEARATNNNPIASDDQLNIAIQHLDEALRSDPPSDTKYLAYFEKARALKRKAMRRDKPERDNLLHEALQELQLARQVAPYYGAPLYNSACYKALLGVDIKEIITDLREAFRLSPNLKELAKKDDDLESVRETPEFKAVVE